MALIHVAAYRLQTLEDARQVDVNNLLPGIDRHLVDHRGANYASVVDQAVNGAVLSDRVSDHALNKTRISAFSVLRYTPPVWVNCYLRWRGAVLPM